MPVQSLPMMQTSPMMPVKTARSLRFQGTSVNGAGQTPNPQAAEPVKTVTKRRSRWAILTPSGMKEAVGGMFDAVGLFFTARGLNKKLRNAKPEVRLQTLDAILKVTAATPRRARLQESLLLRLAQDKDATVRLGLAQKLESGSFDFSGDNLVCPPALWRSLISDDSAEVKTAAIRSAARQLSRYSMLPISEPLKQVFLDKDPAIRIALSEAIINWENPGLIAQFLPALVQDIDPAVRRASVKTIKMLIQPGSGFNAKAAMPFLNALAADPDMSVRRALIQKIAVLLVPDADKQLLLDKMSENASPAIRQYIVRAEACLPNELAVPALRRYALNLNPDIRRKAALAAGHLEDDAAKASVLALGASDPNPTIRDVVRSVASTTIFDSKVKETLLRQSK